MRTTVVTDVFRLEMLPAREGDCLIVTYGDGQNPRRILIDGGRASTWKDLKRHLETVPANQREFELLIVSHVDRDHIEGVLSMLEDDDLPITFKDIWFNGYHHLKNSDIESFGAVQGERLSKALNKPGRKWNAAFDKRAVCVKPDGAAVSVELEGGMRLTVVSPDRAKLQALEPEWVKEVEKAGMIAGEGEKAQPDGPAGYEPFGGIDVDTLADVQFAEDGSKPNGSSIAVIAEFDSRRALLAADAHVDRMVAAIKPLAAAEGGKLRLAAAKLAHHGSKYNVSSELLKLLDCRRYLISTNGSYFNHPDREAVARLIKYGGDNVEIAFNYESDETTVWKAKRLRDKWGYEASYPDGEPGYRRIDL